MKNYFEVTVTVKYESEDTKGNVKIQNVRENYLVDAVSVTEAEARVVNLFKNFSQDFSVVAVKESKILEVVSAETKPKPKPDPILNNANQIAKEKDDEDPI
jgi:hypothetical protein